MLTVAYEGTNYCGWQIQPNGVTIEGELNKALCALLGETITVSGASRTDAGVHAMCNLAVFDTNTRMPADKISFALNQRLPEDIRIQKSQEVSLDFHPRKCETYKTYVYRIYNATFPSPLTRQWAYFVYTPLNVDAMREAATGLLGTHDFKSFCTAKAEVLTTVRTIYECSIEETACANGKLIEIRVTGNGFLYNMVRIIAGTLLQVGEGKLKSVQLQEILCQKDRKTAGPTAPACGLMLENYTFSQQNSIKIY
jgi:tRNA pseudouridine38-40 synthase